MGGCGRVGMALGRNRDYGSALSECAMERRPNDWHGGGWLIGFCVLKIEYLALLPLMPEKVGLGSV